MKDTSSEMFTLQYNRKTTKVKSLVADIEDRSQGRQSLCKSGQPDHQSDHMGTRIGGRWDGRRLRAAARGTGTEVKKGGTWGRTCPLDIPDFSAPGSEDEFLGVEGRLPVSSVMVHQPPALGPTILPFWNETPGVSAAPSSSSPARRTATPSSSSRSKKKKIRKVETVSSSPRNKVRKKILLIETLKGRKKEVKIMSELSLETDRKRKEEKLREEEKKEEKGKGYRHLVFGTSVKATKDAYLQGLGPQTGPGSAPASSSSKSLDSSRRRSSSAAGSAKGRGLQAWQVQE